MEDTRTGVAGDGLEGTLLADRYRILSPLGEGGMATVYLASDTKLARKVVVKIPRREFHLYDVFRERFSREVASLARLQHPNIGRIQDLGEHDGVPFAVLDYLAGGDLKQALDRAGGKESPEQVARWLPHIARALDFIHSKGTLHRDVKPQNILFDERGHVFLSDFGIATNLTTSTHDATTIADVSQLTVAGGFVGTPNFAPPEAVYRRLTPAYDQYSLGVMVYSALSASLPIRSRETSDATMWAKAREEPVPIADLVADLPAGVAQAVMKTLHRDPEQRFASCGAFADAFLDALAADGTASRPPRRGLRAWAAAIVLAGLAATYWAWHQADSQPDPADRAAEVRVGEAPTPEGSRSWPTRQPLVPIATPAPTMAPLLEPSPDPTAAVERPPSPRQSPAPRASTAPSPRVSAAPTGAPSPAEPLPSVAAMGRIDGMVAVPAGAFFAGCNSKVDEECESNERPSPRRQVDGFWIDRTEVTVTEYRRCVDAGRCEAPNTGEGCNWAVSGRDRHPVNCVDFVQADSYCTFVRKRLPTEWEWEKAARGGDGRKYPWGNRTFERAGRVANIADSSLEKDRQGWTLDASYDDGHVNTAPVGTYPAGASPTGALDMVGNVWEWTSSSLDGDATRRIVRGGSWAEPASEARASVRIWSDAAHRRSAGGFRCARSAE